MLKVHQNEKDGEESYECKWPSLKFKKSQKKAIKQGPYINEVKIVKKSVFFISLVCSSFIILQDLDYEKFLLEHIIALSTTESFKEIF